MKQRIIEALPDTEVWELYGASEGGATRVSPKEWLERPGTVGKPWPGVEVRIDGDGDEGVIYIKPAGGATFHYHRDDAKTRRRGATTRSRLATSAASTRTATSTSPIACPTWCCATA